MGAEREEMDAAACRGTAVSADAPVFKEACPRLRSGVHVQEREQVQVTPKVPRRAPTITKGRSVRRSPRVPPPPAAGVSIPRRRPHAQADGAGERHLTARPRCRATRRRLRLEVAAEMSPASYRKYPRKYHRIPSSEIQFQKSKNILKTSVFHRRGSLPHDNSCLGCFGRAEVVMTTSAPEFSTVAHHPHARRGLTARARAPQPARHIGAPRTALAATLPARRERALIPVGGRAWAAACRTAPAPRAIR